MLEGLKYSTYEDIFNTEILPETMTVIGGGPIGCEIGQAYARLGVRVTLVAKHLLRKEDDDARAVVRKTFAREGIRHVSAQVTRVWMESDQVVTHTTEGAEIVADKLFVAVGRTPRVTGLGLDDIGVKYSPKGIDVNDYLRTSVHNIYAAGDCKLQSSKKKKKKNVT